ncbi:MAG: hypothetical protein CMF22_10555 [Idiomarinaceae bacterium]|nr:hypothetical protein [Idiomarinaceae bacterium]MBG23881.1 hypothetical protein [Idiomarinaceae bacterium]|tara:strand:- start:3014 stop:3982 length:969 start_codon:yes stop_codon:yes gene_type:complete
MIEGKGGISAKIIKDSMSSVNGKRITTFELVYPRFIHGEFMTHRMFSRNAASSRAIPIKKVIENIDENTAMPIHWGAAQKGMQAENECNNPVVDWYSDNALSREAIWNGAKDNAVMVAEEFDKAGYHKQIVNRLLEPFQFIKVVCTATEFDNWFWLRDHEDAQPEIAELARCMSVAMEQSFIDILDPGQWHLPYVSSMSDAEGNIDYYIDMNGETVRLSLDEALKVSASCCAQISYRLLDNSLDKALKIYDMLVTSEPVHASPFEHQATPISYDEECKYDKTWWNGWQEGITHQDKDGNFWSGNFNGWIQYRQLIPNNAKTG